MIQSGHISLNAQMVIKFPAYLLKETRIPFILYYTVMEMPLISVNFFYLYKIWR
ncbi:hypothetical protein HZS_4029 [Henneguya salminicola]|nr:hypothetical protein HZS_4029 [Henneguya salminicola]